MPLSDRVKIALLVVGYILCLATLWTAPSMTMGNAAMRVVSPPMRQHCKAVTTNGRCDADDKDCQAGQATADKCSHVVRQAYRWINLGGCPNQIKAWTLCEVEWCQGGDRTACMNECAAVRESLQACKQWVVESYLARNGLDKDGSLKLVS